MTSMRMQVLSLNIRIEKIKTTNHKYLYKPKEGNNNIEKIPVPENRSKTQSSTFEKSSTSRVMRRCGFWYGLTSDFSLTTCRSFFDLVGQYNVLDMNFFVAVFSYMPFAHLTTKSYHYQLGVTYKQN